MIVKLRLRFSKGGRAVYISQLDLVRTLQRSFQRAGYPLKYSEGFNPHPLLSVALPMSVGISSDCEILDFKMEDEPGDFLVASQQITKALPEGLKIISIYYPEVKSSLIRWLEIEGVLDYDAGVDMELSDQLQSVFAQQSIEVAKNSKKGEIQFDIKPHIKSIRFGILNNTQIKLHAFISAQNPTLNPNLLIKALPNDIQPDFARFHRVEIYNEEMQEFR